MIAIRNETSAPAFVLASILTAYPDEHFFEDVNLLLSDSELSENQSDPLSQSINSMKKCILEIQGPASQENLCSEYIDLFDRGRQVNSLYETEYGRERAMVKGNELVDIAGFYKAFGLETGGPEMVHEMVDHVSVELEFYALLVLKSKALQELKDNVGMEIVLDARKKFLQSHLGRFVGAICKRPGVLESAFYSMVFSFCRDLVQEECERLGVEVEEEQWIAEKKDTDAITCGGEVGCLK